MTPFGPATAIKRQIRSLAFDPSGSILVAGTSEGTVLVFDTTQWLLVTEPLADHGGRNVDTVAFSVDGTLLVSGGWDDRVVLREVGNWARVGPPLEGSGLSGTGVAFGAEATSLVWGIRRDNALGSWELSGPGPLGRAATPPGNVNAFAFDGSGQIIATVDPDGPVTIAGKTLPHQTRDATPVTSVAWSGSTVASAAEDGSVIVWDVASGAVVARQEFGDSASAITVDTHGRRAAAATYSDRIQVREIDGWRLMVDLPEGDANVIGLALRSDGGLLAAGTEGGTVLLIDVVKGQLLGMLHAHRDYVRGVAFSPDGATLASVSDDEAMILWDVAAQRQLTEPLLSHTGSLHSVAFSPDGSLVAVGTEQDQLVLWDVPSRRLVGLPLDAAVGGLECAQRPCQPVEDVAFSPDGTAVAAGTIDRGVVMWSLEPASWDRVACLRAGRDLTAEERQRWRVEVDGRCP